MRKKKLQIPAFWWLSCIMCWIAVNACNDGPYKTLNDMPRRSSASKYGMGPEISDHGLPTDWYSDEGNYKMVTKAPAFASCGTYYPVWLKGTLPSQSEGVFTMKACLVFFGNCFSSWDMKVQNCGAFRIYHLQRTGMHSAYCFDPEDNTSPAFNLGAVTVKPDIEFVSRVPLKVPALRFGCDLERFTEGANDLYTVSWQINRKSVWTSPSVTRSNYRDTDLTERKLLDMNMSLGINLKCGVSVKTEADGKTSDEFSSPEFFAGIKVSETSLRIKRGGEEKIKLEVNVPFSCAEGPIALDSCKLVLALIDPNTTYDCFDTQITPVVDKTKTSSVCGTILHGKTQAYWLDSSQRKTWAKNYEILVTTSNNRQYTLTRDTFHLNLQVDDDIYVHDIWRGYKLPQITVSVEDDKSWVRKVCYAHVDPHMKTLDGKKYENQNMGTFILYKHTDYPMEVQITTAQCKPPYTKATCTCAVAVRAGADVFIIDFCHGVPFLGYLNCADDILYVQRKEDTRYVITLPFGTTVEVYFWNKIPFIGFLNVDISSTINDKNRLLGLCGNFNGNENDDFIKPDRSQARDNDDFSNSWRIHVKDSLFNPMRANLPRWSQVHTFCVCPAVKVASGSLHKIIENVVCSPSDSKTCLRNETDEVLHVNCPAIRGPNLSKYNEAQRRLQGQNIGGIHNEDVPPSATVPINVTFAKRRAMCEEKFRSDNKNVFELKTRLPPNNLDDILDNCALDIELLHDNRWIEAHETGWINNVNNEIGKDNSYRNEQEDVVRTVLDNSCPNQCCNRGTCSKGTCRCNTGFGSSDCSINLSVGPVINGIYHDGIWDLSEGDVCGAIPLYGNGFADTEFLTCSLKIRANTLKSKEDVYTSSTKANFESLFEIDCNIPCTDDIKQRLNDAVVHEYVFSISNNGQAFGNEISFYKYHSNCVQSQFEGGKVVLERKPDSCFIDGECFKDGDSNPNNSCQRCTALLSSEKWTYGPGVCPPHSTCRNTEPGFRCDCDQGYVQNEGESGTTCEKKVNGGWSVWGQWSICSVTCGQGTKSRSRTCDNPVPKFGGNDCIGEQAQTNSCAMCDCPALGNWGGWSTCSKSCGTGTQSRSRTCTNQCGGQWCKGKTSESRNCKKCECPALGNWGGWNACSKSCGTGTQSRSRTCTNQCGGNWCMGKTSESRNCKKCDCPVWQVWGGWGACSASCGSGTETRQRTCAKACPQGSCVGSSTQQRGCTYFKPGVWQVWGGWGACSATCGSGIKTRQRSCAKTCPQGRCDGSSTQQTSCTYYQPGVWQVWGGWGACSATCGSGTKTRQRLCSKTCQQGKCGGSSTQQASCTYYKPGVWQVWGGWGACSASCGSGTKTKHRTCAKTCSQGRCDGSSTQQTGCTYYKPGVWQAWGGWGSCSALCGSGTKSRKRTCSKSCSNGSCSGSSTHQTGCTYYKPGVWATWGGWSSCSATCGSGTKRRQRTCVRKCRSGSCSGSSTQTTRCSYYKQAAWTTWGQWSFCDTTCGTRIRSRRCSRSCRGSCSGSSLEEKSCEPTDWRCLRDRYCMLKRRAEALRLPRPKC